MCIQVEWCLMDENWIVLEPALFELLTKQNPKREGIYIQQLLTDLKSIKILLIVLAAITFSIIGILFHIEVIVFLGAAILLLYIFLFKKITNEHINSPIPEGKIYNIVHLHPVISSISITKAILDEDKKHSNFCKNRTSKFNAERL